MKLIVNSIEWLLHTMRIGGSPLRFQCSLQPKTLHYHSGYVLLSATCQVFFFNVQSAEMNGQREFLYFLSYVDSDLSSYVFFFHLPHSYHFLTLLKNKKKKTTFSTSGV